MPTVHPTLRHAERRNDIRGLRPNNPGILCPATRSPRLPARARKKKNPMNNISHILSLIAGALMIGLTAVALVGAVVVLIGAIS
jgi:hypothetical protein